MDKTKLLTVGVIGKSLKENEKRVPIHPEHIERIPKNLRRQITFEEDYGLRFGMGNDTLAKLTSGRVACREEMLSNFLVKILLRKMDFNKVISCSASMSYVRVRSNHERRQFENELITPVA